MRKIIIAIITLILAGQVALAQSADHINGGNFTKTIEYNATVKGVDRPIGQYNFLGKSVLDRIFFGKINSPVEFVFQPSSEMTREASALRIVRDSSHDSYRLETMRLPDSQKAIRILSGKAEQIIIPVQLQASIPLEIMDIIKEHNNQARIEKWKGDVYEAYRPEPEIFLISNEFAKTLYDKTVSLIGNFKAGGIPPIVFDGYIVTFRCVVEDELWTLRIHIPQKRALQLSNLCRQIITDAGNNEFDEGKYLELLDQIDL